MFTIVARIKRSRCAKILSFQFEIWVRHCFSVPPAVVSHFFGFYELSVASKLRWFKMVLDFSVKWIWSRIFLLTGLWIYFYLLKFMTSIVDWSSKFEAVRRMLGMKNAPSQSSYKSQCTAEFICLRSSMQKRKVIWQPNVDCSRCSNQFTFRMKSYIPNGMDILHVLREHCKTNTAEKRSSLCTRIVVFLMKIYKWLLCVWRISGKCSCSHHSTHASVHVYCCKTRIYHQNTWKKSTTVCSSVCMASFSSRAHRIPELFDTTHLPKSTGVGKVLQK